MCIFFQVCLGAEAEDKFHMVEVEGLTYDGKSTKVPLVILKPSVMPSVSKRQMFLTLFLHILLKKRAKKADHLVVWMQIVC